jgi:hypothetical protein
MGQNDIFNVWLGCTFRVIFQLCLFLHRVLITQSTFSHARAQLLRAEINEVLKLEGIDHT